MQAWDMCKHETRLSVYKLQKIINPIIKQQKNQIIFHYNI